MLDPAALEEAGDLVGGVYAGIEALMLDHLVRVMISGDKLDQTSYTALAVAAQTNTAALRRIVDANRGRIDEAVRVTVETYLREADEADVSRVGGEAIWPRQVQGTVDGLATVLERDNLDMVEGAKRAFLEASGRAVTQVNTGAMTTERALHQAVRDLEGKGIDFIQYKNAETGAKTVRNHSDVAVRRHVRTQIAQDAGRMTERRMDEQGIDLVEVSSHPGARPSHKAWQGRCYSRSGEKTIDGVTYPDFYSSTGYGTGAGLCGWNCRHSFGPYLHGTPHSYEPDPKSETGLDDEEIYRLTQRQHDIEREIRSAKREVRGAQIAHDREGTPESLTALNSAKSKLRSRQAKMRDLIESSNARCKDGTAVLHRNPRREWAGDMPVGATRGMSSASSRTVWPGHGRMITREQYKELRDLANSHGVNIVGFRRSDVDMLAARKMIDAAGRMQESFPNLVDGGITLRLSGMHSDDFALIHLDEPGVIRLNREAMRSLDALESEYQKCVSDGLFVAGTHCDAIVYHEVGHMYAASNGIDPLEISRQVTGVEGEGLLPYVGENLSAYAAEYADGREIASEVFAAYYSEVNNDFADSFMSALRRQV